jgi:hypothetical protein
MTTISTGIKDFSEIDFDYSYFVYGLVRQLKPHNVLEIGLGPNGYTGASVVQALEENSRQPYVWYNYIQKAPIKGKYTCIEIEPTNKAVKRLGRFPKDYWDLVVGDSSDLTLYKDIAPQSIDIALIDGDHSEERMYGDTKTVIESNFLEPREGLLVLHDTAMVAHTRRAVQRLRQDFNLDIFEVSSSHEDQERGQSFSIARPKR